MQRRLFALIPILIAILLAGCTGQPTHTIIAEYRDNPVRLCDVIYSAELRSVVDQAVIDAKTRIVYLKVMQSEDLTPLHDSDVREVILEGVREAGSMDSYLEDLKLNRIDWDSNRREIEVELMRNRLLDFFSSRRTEEEWQLYASEHWAEAQSLIARTKGTTFADANQEEVFLLLREQFRIQTGQGTFNELIGQIEHVNLLEDASMKIINKDQPVVRIMHQREPNLLREFRSRDKGEEYFGSTILTSHDLFGRRDFINGISRYFARIGLEDAVRDMTVERPELKVPDEKLQEVQREAVMAMFPDSGDPVGQLHASLADQNVDYTDWRDWITSRTRIDWAFGQLAEVTDEEARRVFLEGEERYRAMLAMKIGIEQTRVNIDDPQMLAEFKEVLQRGRKEVLRGEYERKILDEVKLRIPVPEIGATTFARKSAEELALEEAAHMTEGHGHETGDAHAGGHGDEHAANEGDHAATEAEHSEGGADNH